jgi:hypothetical protein
MTNPTSNFGWQMPTSTDLVTDLPADFETFGQAVDTSLADLKGGTTFQILAKNSNADMDFAWIDDERGDITQVTAGTGISGGGTTGNVTVTNSMATAIDAKGDLVAGTGSDAFARLAVGANGQALVADSTAATGLKYSSNAPSGGMQAINPGGTVLTGASTITISGFSGLSRIQVVVIAASSANASPFIQLRLNGDTGNNYGFAGSINTGGVAGSTSSFAATSIPIGRQGNSAGNSVAAILNLDGTFSSGYVQYNVGSNADGIAFEAYSFSGYYASSAQITSLSLLSTSGNFDNGQLFVFGA